MFNTTCHLAPVGSHHWLSRDTLAKFRLRPFVTKERLGLGMWQALRGQTWQGVCKPPPTTDADGYFPHQEQELLCSYTCRVVPRYIVNIPILTLLHVTVATTIVVLAWQDLLWFTNAFMTSSMLLCSTSLSWKSVTFTLYINDPW